MSQHKKHKLADKLRQRKDTGVDNSPHLIVEARAGTGKTTTLVEGLRIVKGEESKLIPSPQQAAVWAAMAQSRGRAQTVCFVAFNKSIATELQQRVPPGCRAMTMHSMGYAAVRRNFGGVHPSGDRVQNIIAELLDKDIWELRRTRPTLLKATQALVSLCKMNLTDGETCWTKEVVGLVVYYDIDLNGESNEVFALVPRVLERCKEVDRDKCIDFDDMVWLPIALDLPVQKYDLLLVDEAQDLNRCQQALAMKAGRRLILCGDPKQAIYGFAGADAESMERMERTLLGNQWCPNNEIRQHNWNHGPYCDDCSLPRKMATDRGCITLPLTVTRRCGKAIVKEAQAIMPDFEAHETCGEGIVTRMRFEGEVEKESDDACYRWRATDGDMILCRVNAPLVSECFKFLKAGRKANIQGRDVGQGLVSTIIKMKAERVGQMLVSLDLWLDREQAKEQRKRNPSEARLIALQDRVDCIFCFAEDVETVEEVVQKIEAVFTDDKNLCPVCEGKECAVRRVADCPRCHGTGRSLGIMLSSIHKAKGLEAQRVFLLEPEGATVPHPMAKTPWQREQEMNLRYVAITRAISELVYVS